jgi:hypothetical protein
MRIPILYDENLVSHIARSALGVVRNQREQRDDSAREIFRLGRERMAA